MTSQSNFTEAKVTEIVEGVTALISAPIVFAVAEGVKQPLVQTAIKEGIILSERLKEAVAETGEVIEDLTAQAQLELTQERQRELTTLSTRTTGEGGQSHAAVGIQNVLSILNEHTGRMTNGVADLRLLMSLGLGALAIRQLIVKGLEIEEMPWYTLAWYAFDSFVKFNREAPPALQSGETEAANSSNL